MKTKLEFLEEIDKRIVKIKHSEDIKIFKENRKNHQEWQDINGSLIDKNVDYIIILISKEKISLKDIEDIERGLKRDEMIITGYQFWEADDYYEISAYNSVAFAKWVLPAIENSHFFSKKDFSVISHYVLPTGKDDSGYYVNPRGFQLVYNFGSFIKEIIYSLKEKHKK